MMTPSIPPFEHGTLVSAIPEEHFWAKLSRDRVRYHPLLAHSADVAAVLARLLRPDSVLRARLARALGLEHLSESMVAMLVYLAALHDLGKANNGFQSERYERSGNSPGHVRIVLKSLSYRELQTVWRDLLTPLGGKPAQGHEFLQTAICHHGRPWDQRADTPNDLLWQRDKRSMREPLTEIRRLGELARVWSGVSSTSAGDPLSFTPTFLHLFAGVLTLADWVGSTEVAFPFAPEAGADPHGYWREAQILAARACASIGLTPRTTVVSMQGVPLLQHIFPSVFGAEQSAGRTPAQPTPLQRRVAEMDLPPAGSRLLVESETGSGKTEAALALFARLRAAERVGGLIFALPTRSTASAMHERVTAALAAMYEPGERPTVALAMGGEQAHAEVTGGAGESRALLAADPLTYPDEPELVRWSSGSTKKFFAAEIVIGTLDQVLLSGLTVKHAHLRLAALSRHLLVVDELHSYDLYMAEVLQRVLDVHSSVGGMALLMSATLSDRERQRFGGLLSLDDEQAPLAEAIARPYPVVSVCERPGELWVDEQLAVNAGVPKPPLGWQLCDEDMGLTHAVTAARAGARVCVLRNTVGGARATVDRLRNEGADDVLWRPDRSEYTPAYHSRYTLPDRKTLDRAVLASYGRGCSSGNTRILVATQVAEQSLDVDFDVLVTDLCPIDVLLQRLGRVWRHRERDALRPNACSAVQAWVIEPTAGFEPLLQRKYGGPNGWGTVYEHLGLLELTRRAVRGTPKIAVPRDNRSLVESVYHTQKQGVLRSEGDAWEHHFEAKEGASIGQQIIASQATISFGETYIENGSRFNHDLTGAVRTRLGDDRVRVLLPAPLMGFYSTDSTHSVDLRVEDLMRAGLQNNDLKEPRAASEESDGKLVRFSLKGFEFAYGPQGWTW